MSNHFYEKAPADEALSILDRCGVVDGPAPYFLPYMIFRSAFTPSPYSPGEQAWLSDPWPTKQFRAGQLSNLLLRISLFGRGVDAQSAQMKTEPGMDNRSPNKAMEPTPVNVTIPAYAGIAPFTSVAHLRRWAKI